MLFLQHFCEQLSMDKKDVIAYFRTLRLKYTDDEIHSLFDNDNYEITKLDINRMFRFIDGHLLIDDV